MQVSSFEGISFFQTNDFLHRKLINVHGHNLPDPYVRVYLMPDFKKDKKKTKSIHDTLNPAFDDL